MTTAGRSQAIWRAGTRLRSIGFLAVLLLTAAVAHHASAYTLEYCKQYADKVVQESTAAELSTAMRGTTSDPGISGIVGGSSGGDTSLSSILGGLAQSQNQQTLWQRTFDHCMGVTR